jgi:adenylate kinase
MFRDHVTRNTPLGQQAKAIVERGELVSDEIVSAMVAERIRQPDCAGGFILDGFPRTRVQAERLDEILAEASFSSALAINLQVGYDNLIRRICGRRTCSVCGEIYNIFNRPPRVQGRCDRDGGELIERADDREEVVRKRLDTYEQQTKPLVEFYRQRGALLEVNGEQAAEELTRQLIPLVESAVGAGVERRT